MIDQVDRATVDALAERTDGPWVSIYLPTERLGPNQPSKIRLKNLLTEAKAVLTTRGVDDRVISAIAKHGATVLGRQELWHARERGLAVHVSAEEVFVHRLAEPCEQTVVVADSPQVDLLRSIAEQDRSFAVLALSLNDIRLFRGNQQGLVEDDPPVLPARMSDVLVGDDREPQLQSHSGGRVGSGNVTASFHGQSTNDQADTDRFLRSIDRALTATIDADLPIVLAGVDRIVAAYRQLSHHRGLLPEAIHGNVSRTAASELHAKAWAIVESSKT